MTDVNECEQEPYPCDESAICHNTDGSFYCECQEGFSGDGFECTGNAMGEVLYLGMMSVSIRNYIPFIHNHP